MKVTIRTKKIEFKFESPLDTFNGTNVLVADLCALIEKVTVQSNDIETL